MARELEEALKDPNRAKSTQVLSFHGSLPADKRSTALELFRRPPASTGATGEHNNAPPPRVLVATGRASKGLSFAGRGAAAGAASGADSGAAGGDGVGHVILFEFPPDAKAYIARVGFATRGDAPTARVTALAVAKQLPFARAMLRQDASGTAHALDL